MFSHVAPRVSAILDQVLLAVSIFRANASKQRPYHHATLPHLHLLPPRQKPLPIYLPRQPLPPPFSSPIASTPTTLPFPQPHNRHNPTPPMRTNPRPPTPRQPPHQLPH